MITNEKVITNHYSSVQAAQVPQKLLAKSEHFLGGPCATAQCIASWWRVWRVGAAESHQQLPSGYDCYIAMV